MKHVICAALVLAMFSCKKKNEDATTNTTTPSVDQLVGTYKQTAESTTAMGQTADTWNTNSHQACEMDDTYALAANGSFSYTDAGNSCGSGNNYNGTWSVNGNHFVMAGDTYTVEGFDGTNLHLSSSETQNGMTITYKVTFSKQ